MFKVKYKKSFVNIEAVWFANEKINDKDVDIIYYHQILDKNKFLSDNIDIFNTLCIDLKNTEDEIFSGFNKDVKYEIRRAIKDNTEIKIFDSEDLKNNIELVQKIENFYNSFLKSKNLKGRFNRILIDKYIENNNATVSIVEKNNEMLVLHLYINDKNIARLLYSASLYRLDIDKSLKSFTGRANRLLHWEDIRYFKEKGLSVYDWGGIGDSQELKGINKFKEGFNGKEKIFYNMIQPITLKGKGIMLVKDFIDKFKVG